jgi:hypothetical protein
VRWSRWLFTLALVSTNARAEERRPVPRRHEPLSRADVTAESPRWGRLDVLSSPRLPAPFSLPELSHPRRDLGVTWLVGGAVPAREGSAASAVGLMRLSTETYLKWRRRLYLGVTVPIAAARPLDDRGGARSLFGNVELHVRWVFPMPSWLTAGALLGMTVPTASFDRHDGAAEVARIASSLEPTDAVHFLPGRVAFRPGLDLRLLRGPFVAQLREGIDVIVDDSGAEETELAGRLLAHLGVLLGDDVELSLETTQVYFLAPPPAPEPGVLGAGATLFARRRSGTTISPGARVSLGKVDVGLGVVTDLMSPLAANVDRLFAVRLSVIAHFR